MTLDRDAAVAAVAAARRRSSGCRLLETAEGILTIANSNMARAIRSRTIEKGHDPREFALVAFGGAGPLHAAEVADSLGIPEVLVPPYPGITSADGPADERPQVRPDAHRLPAAGRDRRRAAQPRARRARGASCAAGSRATASPTTDDRGRSARSTAATSARATSCGSRSPTAPFTEAALEEFHRLHEREYGSAYGDPIEIVNARVTAIGRRPTLDELPVASGTLRRGARRRERERLPRRRAAAGAADALLRPRRCCRSARRSTGPAVVFQRDTTTVVPPGWSARADALREPDPDEGGAP